MPKVTVSGANEWRRGLSRYSESIEDAQKTMRKVGEEGARLVRAVTPIRTGRLVGTTKGSGNSRTARVKQGTPVRAGYAFPLNYGTRKGRPGTRHINSVDPAWERIASDLVEKMIRDNKRLLP